MSARNLHRWRYDHGSRGALRLRRRFDLLDGRLVGLHHLLVLCLVRQARSSAGTCERRLRALHEVDGAQQVAVPHVHRHERERVARAVPRADRAAPVHGY